MTSKRTTFTRRHVLAGASLVASATMIAPRLAGAAEQRVIRPQPAKLAIVDTQIGDLDLDVWAYDGQVPGPLLRYRQGDILDITLDNGLPEPTSLHWHGLRVPNAMDGAPPLTQNDVSPGSAFRYTFELKDAGTYWYHTHTRGWNQQDRGLYGPLIVDEMEPPEVDSEVLLVLDDWMVEPDGTVSEDRFGNMHDWAHAGRLGSLVTVNSQDQPSLPVTAGERIRVRVINVANAQIFSLVFEGHDPWMIARDGDPVDPKPMGSERATLGPGQRADFILDATGAPDTTHDIKAYSLTGEGPIASLSYASGTKVGPALAGKPVSPLPSNNRPEPDLANAVRIPLKLEGGAMGRMQSARFDGREMGFRELIANRKVWAFNGAAGDMQAPMARVPTGQSVIMPLENATRWPHSIHLHGMHFRTLKRNGATVEEGFRDTITLGPMENAEIAFFC
jgi:FtsP/CotA-like multicopper oxidase with cupredoxin domain